MTKREERIALRETGRPKRFGVILSRAMRLVKRDYDVRRRLGGGDVGPLSREIAEFDDGNVSARIRVARLARRIRARLREKETER